MLIRFDPTKHVTFPMLGRFGRLGNQLFQLFATVAHAQRQGLQPLFPPAGRDCTLRKLFDFPDEWFSLDTEDQELGKGWVLRYDAPWNYEPVPLDARILHGYFQDPRFWTCGGLSDHPSSYLAAHSLLREEHVAVHVRLGDYHQLEPYHPVLPWEWYEKALKRVGQRQKTVLCTDGRPLVVNNMGGPRRLLSLGTLEDDFRIMLEARYLVMSNSTLSWWAAYLGQAKRVIYPLRWFGPELSDHQVTQLFPSKFAWEGLD